MTVPIPLVLDLWSQGYSAGAIHERLDIPGGVRGIGKIIAHARELGDARAVYHRLGWRLIGSGIPEDDRYVTPVQRRYAGFRIVPLLDADGNERRRKDGRESIPPKRCKRGHLRTADNLFNRGCLVCKRERQRLAYHAKKDSA